MYNGILISYKKNEILLFSTIWMELEDTMLSEFKKMAEYKTKTHKNAYISNNKRADTKIKNTIPFIIIQQKWNTYTL